MFLYADDGTFARESHLNLLTRDEAGCPVVRTQVSSTGETVVRYPQPCPDQAVRDLLVTYLAPAG